MLKLSLSTGEYLTIDGKIVVQIYRADNGRSYLAIDAPRDVPIVRGAVLEREGGKKPEKLVKVPPKGHRSELPI